MVKRKGFTESCLKMKRTFICGSTRNPSPSFSLFPYKLVTKTTVPSTEMLLFFFMSAQLHHCLVAEDPINNTFLKAKSRTSMLSVVALLEVSNRWCKVQKMPYKRKQNNCREITAFGLAASPLLTYKAEITLHISNTSTSGCCFSNILNR